MDLSKCLLNLQHILSMLIGKYLNTQTRHVHSAASGSHLLKYRFHILFITCFIIMFLHCCESHWQSYNSNSQLALWWLSGQIGGTYVLKHHTICQFSYIKHHHYSTFGTKKSDNTVTGRSFSQSGGRECESSILHIKRKKKILNVFLSKQVKHIFSNFVGS